MGGRRGVRVGTRIGVGAWSGSLVRLLACCALAACACARAQDLEARAAAARDADNIPAALDLYRQAVQQKPEWLEGWWFLGLLDYESGRFVEGRQAFAEFTKLNAESPAGWAFLGLCEYETGGYDAALEHLERALAPGARLDPEVGQVAHFHRALLLTRAGFFDRARDELKPFAERGIRDPVLTGGLGLNALEVPMLPQDVPAAQRDLVDLAGQAAYACIKGDAAQTGTAFHALLGKYPNAPGVHYLYATYLLTVQPEAMDAELRRELEVNPANARARAALALRLALEGDAATALPLAKKAAEDAPGLGLAQYAYGMALDKTGALSDAIAHFETAVRVEPDNLGYHTALASAYSEAGRYQDARSERQASIKLAKESGGPG